MKRDRLKSYRKGQRAEHLAALALRLKGFRLVARRYKTPVGEVDLIMRRGDVVLFVEVKARATRRLALDNISRTAQQRIEAAAHWWLGRQSEAGKLSWRFDVVAVVPRRWPIHFENVW